MAENENKPSEPKKTLNALGEVILKWGVPAAAVVTVVVGTGHGISYVVKSEIRPLEHTVSSFESRFDVIDGQFANVDKQFDRVDKQFDRVDVQFNKVDRRFEKINERLAKADAKFDKRSEKVDEQFSNADVKFDRQSEKVDEQFAKVDERIDRQSEKVDEQFAKVDERIDRLETKVDLNAIALKQLVEGVNQMNRKMDAHLMLHSQESDEEPRASLSEPDGEEPVKPVAKSTDIEDSSSG